MYVGTNEYTARRNNGLNNHLKLTLFKIVVICCNFKLKGWKTGFLGVFFALTGDFRVSGQVVSAQNALHPDWALSVTLFLRVEVKNSEFYSQNIYTLVSYYNFTEITITQFICIIFLLSA